MKYEIVKLEDFSGEKANIYSFEIGDEEITLFDRFVKENEEEHEKEVDFIIDQLFSIGHDTGARDHFFQHDKGGLTDGISQLRYKEMRLYCIIIGRDALVLGGGGPKRVRAWQEDPKLNTEVSLLKKLSQKYLEYCISGDITWDEDEIEGDLEFDID